MNFSKVITLISAFFFLQTAIAQTQKQRPATGPGSKNQLTIISDAVSKKVNADAVVVNVKSEKLMVNIAKAGFAGFSNSELKKLSKQVGDLAMATIKKENLQFPKGKVSRVIVSFFVTANDPKPKLESTEIYP